MIWQAERQVFEPVNMLSTAIVSPFLALFYILVIRKCIHAFFLPTPLKLPNYLVWIAYFLFQVYVGMGEPLSPVITLLLNMFFVFLVTSSAHSESLRKCSIFSFLICAIWMLVEIIVHMILYMLKFDDSSGLSGNIISKILMLVFAIITGNCLQQRSITDISFRYMAILFIVPAGSIYIMHNIFVISNQSSDELLFSFISGILLLFINYVIFEVFESLAQNTDYQKKTLLYEQQLDLCNQQAKEREVQDAELRMLRHDIKQHLICLLGMVNANKNEEAVHYLTALLENGTSRKIHEISRSGNIVVDSLVNYKCSVAQKEHIEFNANIFIPPVLPFQNGNLTIILGNLLENALNACRHIQIGKRMIGIQMTYQKEILSIVVWNTLEDSSKDSPSKHVMGMLSIEQAVATYNGEVITETEGNIFKAAVILYEGGET